MTNFDALLVSITHLLVQKQLIISSSKSIDSPLVVPNCFFGKNNAYSLGSLKRSTQKANTALTYMIPFIEVGQVYDVFFKHKWNSGIVRHIETRDGFSINVGFQLVTFSDSPNYAYTHEFVWLTNSAIAPPGQYTEFVVVLLLEEDSENDYIDITEKSK